MDFIAVAYILLTYIIGSIPTGYLVARWLKGVDIRRVGSGNPGATNVFRTVGKTAGILTLLIDMLKGGAPVWAAMRYFETPLVPVLCGLAATVGHTWSLFLNFNGGKGVATSAGVFLALLPVPTLAAVLTFGLGFAVSRHVSVGSLVGAAVLAPVAFWRHGATLPSYLALALGVLIIVRHIPNIRRLIRGEELSLKKIPLENKENK